MFFFFIFESVFFYCYKLFLLFQANNINRNGKKMYLFLEHLFFYGFMSLYLSSYKQIFLKYDPSSLLSLSLRLNKIKKQINNICLRIFQV